MKKKPTAENVAEELLRELVRIKEAGEPDPKIDTLAALVSRRLTGLTQQQLDAGRLLLNRYRVIGKNGDRYFAGSEAKGVLSAIDEGRQKSHRWAIGAAIALLTAAATIWAVYMAL